MCRDTKKGTMFFKNRAQYCIAFLIFFSVVAAQAQTTTTDVALKMGYYDYVRHLRNTSTDHLRALESRLKNRTNILRSTNHAGMADERDREYHGTLNALQNKFDAAFEAIDQDLIFYGDTLDADIAPVGEKEEFIQNRKNAITDAINHIIDQSPLPNF